MNSNYEENGVDLDYVYIRADDVNYFPLETLNVTGRKVVAFGQNALTNVYPIGNLGNAFNTANVNVPKVDLDSDTRLETTLPTGAVFKDTKTGNFEIRGNFALVENYPQTNSWQLGITARSSPVQVGALTNWSQGAFGRTGGAAIKTDGTLWTWGRNNHGQLGLSDTIDRSSPVQVGALTDWKQVACGYRHATAIKTDGTLWAWGNNSYGQLGLSLTNSISSPTQVGALTNWAQVACGDSHTAFIKTDGTLWTCGLNSHGQLGLSNITHRSSPTQIGNLSTWKYAVAGNFHTMAINTGNTLWAWGYNFIGQLGTLDMTNRSSPVQVGIGRTFSLVSGGQYHTSAIDTQGFLYSWGANSFGQLGVNDITHRSSPVQVGNLSMWKQVSCGSDSTAAINISYGGILTWGSYIDGTLGISSVTHRVSPVSIAPIETEIPGYSISSGYANVMLIRTNGTLWAWGANSFGQLGLQENGLLPYKLKYGI